MEGAVGSTERRNSEWNDAHYAVLSRLIFTETSGHSVARSLTPLGSKNGSSAKTEETFPPRISAGYRIQLK